MTEKNITQNTEKTKQLTVGEVRVGKYDFLKKRCPVIKDFTNILIHVKDELSPYVVHEFNSNGEKQIMENTWQFSKLYDIVQKQEQTVHKYTKEKGWHWDGEKHAEYIEIEGKKKLIIEDVYWKWREEGMKFKHPVRYSNGFAGRKRCLCALLLNNNITGEVGIDYVEDLKKNKYEILDYIQARKKIYFPIYNKLIITTPFFKNLQIRLKNGENLQIVEVDGPKKASDYPYNLAENNSIIINKEIAHALVNNITQNFGHGYCCAISLLDGKDWIV